jgi:hypothetical protein
MNKTFAALVAVATLAGSLAVTPASAQRGLGAPPPPCRFVRERFWDGYAWRFRRVEVCN